MSGPTVTVVSSPLAPLKKPEPPPPAPFKIDSSTKLEDWKKWQISFRHYAHITHLDQMSHEVQISAFKSMVGPDAMEIYNTFSILDITDVESVMQKFDEHFKPKANVTLERYKLYKLHQKSGQKFDDYLAEITSQVDKCGFDSMRDEIILYKVVGGIDNDEVRNSLLADADLKLDAAVQICRASSFLSGKENSRKKKAAEMGKSQVLTVGAKKNQKAGSGAKTSRTPAPEPAGSMGLETGGHLDEKRADASDDVTGFLGEFIVLRPSRPMEKVTKDASTNEDASCDDDCRGVDDDYEIEIDSVDPNRISNKDSEEYENKPKRRVTDVKKRKWRRKSLQKKSYPTSDKRLACDMCDKTFRIEISLEKHRKTHLPPEQRDVSCYHCGKVYKKNILRRHMGTFHADILGIPGPEKFTCDVCAFTTRFPGNLERHKFQHTGEKPLACEHCDYKCITTRLLKAHIAKQHTGERPFTCSVCNRGFLHSDAMKRHMVVHLPPREKIQKLVQMKCTCETCGNVYASKASLRNHIMIHKGEKPYACEMCEFRGVTSGALSAHKLSKHSDEKPFVCSICGYSCKQHQGLKRHMLTHTNEKPYACDICGRRFLQSTHVKRHMLVHTGEKPHVCEICGQRWAQKANLRAHMKVHQKQSGFSCQSSPPRKNQKTVLTIIAAQSDESDSETAPTDAIIQWSEQVTAVNSLEYTSNLDNPPPPYPTYTTHQGNTIPADCIFYQQRTWPNQGYR